ncbi:EF-P lysine aminoacylase GenX [Candidatus Uhrbacteria bacterium]|jgi:elongation factor P--(R)-beta-lysine ligase|nr:EF-P lysine aminoacylase GenX [Candidatus Uhrbacteria bacterium]
MNNVTRIATERQRINDSIRSFFRARNYLEVETPIVVASPGMEPNLSPFESAVHEPDGTKYDVGLITSPEYSMKKLLGQGMNKIFTLTKVFRNKESFGGCHNPEFTMLEWYQQGKSYIECMDETELLVRSVAQEFDSERFDKKFERVRVRDLFIGLVGYDLDHESIEGLEDACATHKISTHASDTKSDLFYRLFLSLVEPTLKGRNIFIYDYPKHQAALAQLTSDGKYGQRFELYLDGLELCNGFTELTNAAEQRERFVEEVAERKVLGEKIFPIDEELLGLLGSIQNPTFGNALGIDRLHMVVTGSKSIDDVLLFPASKLFKRA